VPRGKVTKHVWQSQIFPNTIREYFVYVPAQYDGSRPAAVMVFQDGLAYANEDGEFRAPVVLDNLIQRKELPVIVALFINPGNKGSELPANPPWGASNRSFEYDTLSDQYARFLLEEMLPEVGKAYKLTDSGNERAICGISSGGICALPWPGSGPTLFRKCSRTSAVLRTSAAATFIRR